MPPKVAWKSGKERDQLLTTQQCEGWKQTVGTEKRTQKSHMAIAVEKIKEHWMKPTAYFAQGPKTKGERLYTNICIDEPPVTLAFTLDKIQDDQPYDPKCKRDTKHPTHSARRRGLSSSMKVRTSQQYGWYKPYDVVKYGFGKRQVCKEEFLEQTHLG